MRRALVVGAAVLALAAGVLVVLHGRPAQRSEVVRLQVGARVRSYVAVVPRSRDDGADLVVFLPGLGMTASDGRRLTKLDRGAREHGAVLVYAQGVDTSWNAGLCCGGARQVGINDVGYLTSLIADARRRYDVRPARVDLVGFSNGALMAYRFLCERADLVQAVVAASGTSVVTSCQLARPVTLLALHGLQDPVVPFLGGRSSLNTHGRFLAVTKTVLGLATRDGCSGTRTSIVNAQVTAAGATGCPPGVQVALLTSKTMGHQWATGTSARSRFGWDESTLTWDFLSAHWG